MISTLIIVGLLFTSMSVLGQNQYDKTDDDNINVKYEIF